MRYQSENLGGNFVFRCKRHSHWEVDMHLHEYSEILYCEKGTCEVNVNGESFLLRENEFLWLPPNYIHMYKAENASLLCAVFSNDYVPLFYKMTGEKKLKVSAVSASGIEYLFEKTANTKAENFLTLGGCLTLICARVFENSVLEESRAIDEILYQKVISYISEHYADDVTLSDIAKRFGYNEKYLSHTLHELTGIHFRKLITIYRINKAKDMLLSKNDLNVSDIADACGFSALNTFHRAFKEITGVTPTEYKKASFLLKTKTQFF